jgi:hypothetical protein
MVIATTVRSRQNCGVPGTFYRAACRAGRLARLSLITYLMDPVNAFRVSDRIRSVLGLVLVTIGRVPSQWHFGCR